MECHSHRDRSKTGAQRCVIHGAKAAKRGTKPMAFLERRRCQHYAHASGRVDRRRDYPVVHRGRNARRSRVSGHAYRRTRIWPPKMLRRWRSTCLPTSLPGRYAPTSLNFPLNFIVNTIPADATPTPLPPASDKAGHGRYLASGGLLHCHTPGGRGSYDAGRDYAGGRAFERPEGLWRGPNLTPDDETGLGLGQKRRSWARSPPIGNPATSCGRRPSRRCFGRRTRG